jgi:hypothetical protein
MRDIAAEWAEIDVAEAELKKVIDRLVEMIPSDEIIGSGKAGLAILSVGRVAARSIVAALGRAELPWQQKRLIHVLDGLGLLEEPEVTQEIERFAEEDPSELVRDHATYVLDELMEQDLCEDDVAS